MVTRLQQPNSMEARHAAAAIVRQYGFQIPGELVLEDIAFAAGIEIEIGHLNKAEAWLLREGTKGLIRVADRTMEPGRRRFAIGHELGHWFLHQAISQAWACTSDDIHAYRGSTAEIEANAFSAELLMPRTMLRLRVGTQPLTMKLVCEIAEAFNTTLTATAVRLVEESKDDCAVVFSQMGLVRWYRRSNTGFNFFLQSNTPLRDTSRAFECGTEPSRSRGPRPVPLEAWIFNPRYGEELEIWEESVFLPEYQTVITLLGFN